MRTCAFATLLLVTSSSSRAVGTRASARLHRRTSSLRAQQIVRANEWWCTQSDPSRNASLGCRRHALQQQHAVAKSDDDRSMIMKHLNVLLKANEHSLHAETKEMMQHFCAEQGHVRLLVCTDSMPTEMLLLHASWKHGSSGFSGSGTKGVQRQVVAGRGGGRKGMAVLWTADTLNVLRTWWCADRRHAREPRCARGVRWTRQQPGLSAMRRLFCAQSKKGGSNVARLCLGAPGVPPAAVGLSRAERLQALPALSKNVAALVHRRPLHGIRPATVNKIMLAMLVLSALCGCAFSRLCHRRQHRGDSGGSWLCLFGRARGTHSTIEPVQFVAAEELKDFVVSGSAARRRGCGRYKRARTAAAGEYAYVV